MIEKIHIQNFKSIRDADLGLRPINVLVGPNGAGKSNFVEFFNFLTELVSRNLTLYTAKNGGSNRLIHLGLKNSEKISGSVNFKNSIYLFELTSKNDGGFFFSREEGNFYSHMHEKQLYFTSDAIGKTENGLLPFISRNWENIQDLQSYSIYHFHDTSKSAPLKQIARLADTRFLRSDGSNLAAFLYDLRQSYLQSFSFIEAVIKQIAPFFDRFNLFPDGDYIRLIWKQKGTDMYLDVSDFSDGTLRFIALATLLLQPNPPAIILIDEPELGLHPYAITILAGLIKSISSKSQIIVSTQSVNLVNEFEAQDIIVVENQNSESTFRRLDEKELADWLQEYTIGELWNKNVFGGNP